MLNETRFIELEIKITEQEKLIEELSILITNQWHRLEQLHKKLDALSKRFLELEEQAQPAIPITRPPHW
ncbi:SlyX family protein [Bartonella sp. DGB2]|uniref:SlyX family protein n=1 Tax=Bartonella sp. DGB2 TaxID=3388426 RepID=UPI00398FCFF2